MTTCPAGRTADSDWRGEPGWGRSPGLSPAAGAHIKPQPRREPGKWIRAWRLLCQLERGARGAPKGAPVLGTAGRRLPLFPTGPAIPSTSARPFGPSPLASEAASPPRQAGLLQILFNNLSCVFYRAVPWAPPHSPSRHSLTHPFPGEQSTGESILTSLDRSGSW